MPEPIKVLIVDDSADLADALAMLIDQEADLRHVGTLNRADDLVSGLERLNPDVALVDLTMAGMAPLQAVREASEKHARTRMIIYSGHDDAAVVEEALDSGAWGFVSKHSEFEKLIDSIRRVWRGEIVNTR